MKTIRRIICVQQIYTNCLCVSKSRPFIGLMIIVKKFREYILLTRSPSKYFSTFQKLFEDVYICYCCCFYSMCLRCFLLPWTIFSSVQNGRFGENLQNWIMHFSLYYCFLYIPIWIIWYIWYFCIPIDVKCSKYKWSFKKCVWSLFKLPFIVE